MRTTIEVSHKFNLGDIVYGIHRDKAVKAKITLIEYQLTESILTDTVCEKIKYFAMSLDEPLNESYSWNYSFAFTNDDKTWFKSKDDAIDYLKTQIDKITTDDYNQTFVANN